jgi:putative chitinase
MLTTEQLHTIMPGLPAAKGAQFFPFLSAAIAEFGIDAPARTAAFVAQLAHESGQFKFMEELWGPTAAQQRYEPTTSLSTTLGNTEVGDGRRFKGRGPIQITGRANYRRFGDLLGLSLIDNPASAALPDVAFRVAGLFWSKKGLNELADQVTPEAFREITRRINGGFNGLAERERFYEAAKAALGVMGPAVTRGGPPVEADATEPAFERGVEAVRSDVPPAVRRRRPIKKAAAKKTTSKKSSTKKASVKKASAKKTSAKKSSVKKATVKKATVKKSAAAKGSARKRGAKAKAAKKGSRSSSKARKPPAKRRS